MLYFIGIVLIGTGIAFFTVPVFYDHFYRVTFDLTEIRWYLSPFSIIVGCYSIFLAYSKQRAGFTTEYWICPKCQDTIKLTNDGKIKCQKCNIELEKLEGFFKQHPELKEKSHLTKH